MIINKEEVLRYLGYGNQVIDLQLDTEIDLAINEIKNIARPLYTYQVFTLKDLEEILRGEDIYNHLGGGVECVVMAATVGYSVDQLIRRNQVSNLTKALILDACGTVAIESLWATVEDEIIEMARKKGYYATSPYSPGYGDFPLEVQKEIEDLLNLPQKIGVTVTADFLLVPRKSITGIMGFSKKLSFNEVTKCKKCIGIEHCLYKKEVDCYRATK